METGRIATGTSAVEVKFNPAFGGPPALMLGIPTQAHLDAVLPFATLSTREKTTIDLKEAKEECGYDGSHESEKLDWLAIRPGIYLTDGHLPFEVGTYTINGNSEWNRISFRAPFDTNDIVVTPTLQGVSNKWTPLRIQSVDGSGFSVRLDAAKSGLTVTGTFTMSFLAIQAGGGTIAGRSYEAVKTMAQITHIWKKVEFNRIKNPRLFGDFTRESGDTALMRMRNNEGDSVELRIQEPEKCWDGSHTAEAATVLVVSEEQKDPPCAEEIEWTMETDDPSMCVPLQSGGRIMYVGTHCGDGKIKWLWARALDIRSGLTPEACIFEAKYEEDEALRKKIFGSCGVNPNISGAALLPAKCQKAPLTLCVDHDNWRKNYGGSANELKLLGKDYGNPTADWETCQKACADDDACLQAVFQKETKKCFGSKVQKDEDQDGIGGFNTGWISAHCYVESKDKCAIPVGLVANVGSTASIQPDTFNKGWVNPKAATEFVIKCSNYDHYTGHQWYIRLKSDGEVHYYAPADKRTSYCQMMTSHNGFLWSSSGLSGTWVEAAGRKDHLGGGGHLTPSWGVQPNAGTGGNNYKGGCCPWGKAYTIEFFAVPCRVEDCTYIIRNNTLCPKTNLLRIAQRGFQPSKDGGDYTCCKGADGNETCQAFCDKIPGCRSWALSKEGACFLSDGEWKEHCHESANHTIGQKPETCRTRASTPLATMDAVNFLGSNADLKETQVYTYPLANGYIAKLKGWTKINAIASGVLRDIPGDATAVVPGLFPGREYIYKIYMFASQNQNINHPFSVNGVDKGMLKQHSSKQEVVTDVVKADSKGKITFKFGRSQNAVHLSAIAIAERGCAYLIKSAHVCDPENLLTASTGGWQKTNNDGGDYECCKSNPSRCAALCDVAVGCVSWMLNNAQGCFLMTKTPSKNCRDGVTNAFTGWKDKKCVAKAGQWIPVGKPEIEGGDSEVQDLSGDAHYVQSAFGALMISWSDTSEPRDKKDWRTYDKAVEFGVPGSVTASPRDAAAKKCNDKSFYSKVAVTCVKGECNMPSTMYTGKGFGRVCYNQAFGLVGAGASDSCDWTLDTQGNTALYLGNPRLGHAACHGVKDSGGEMIINYQFGAIALWTKISAFNAVKVVPVAGGTISAFRRSCGTGWDLVSVKSIEHIRWLREVVAMANFSMTLKFGILLAYDYSGNKKFESLQSRESNVDWMFAKLKDAGEFTGTYDSGTTGNVFAGFGWGKSSSDVGMASWPIAGDKTHGVICEKVASEQVAPLADSNFNDRGESVLDKTKTYEYELANGYKCKLSGWTHTKPAAKGFVRTEKGLGYANVEGLTKDATYAYRIYMYASNAPKGSRVPVSINGKFIGSLTQDDTGEPAGSGYAVADANGKIVFTFSRQKDGKDAHLSGIALAKV
eukprot:TRINITY_DN64493_c0_g1_i1.p1 TRINITY_DN64493_c0_g1~~TRINITY_DN64493_c0_g1_i1.p1  ORF type:complete len:1614 (+),score=284.76 TRINITY_DN64493_c0_g1_i1:639-4844(+)